MHEYLLIFGVGFCFVWNKTYMTIFKSLKMIYFGYKLGDPAINVWLYCI